MKALPDSEDSLLIRTDFTDEIAWQSLCRAVKQPVGEFQAYVHCVSNPEFDGVEPSRLIEFAQSQPNQAFLFVADRESFQSSEMTLLAVDLREQPGRSFRLVPSVAWSVENNLSIANMDFSEFAEATDDRGIFRGFSDV